MVGSTTAHMVVVSYVGLPWQQSSYTPPSFLHVSLLVYRTCYQPLDTFDTNSTIGASHTPPRLKSGRGGSLIHLDTQTFCVHVLPPLIFCRLLSSTVHQHHSGGRCGHWTRTPATPHSPPLAPLPPQPAGHRAQVYTDLIYHTVQDSLLSLELPLVVGC